MSKLAPTYGILTGSWQENALDIRVSSNMLSRALRIFDAIIKYFNRQAVPVVVENAHRRLLMSKRILILCVLRASVVKN